MSAATAAEKERGAGQPSISLRPTEVASYPKCTPYQEAENWRTETYLTHLTSLQDQITSVANGIDASTRDLTPLRQLLSRHSEVSGKKYRWTECSPSYDRLKPLRSRYNISADVAIEAMDRAVAVVYRAANAYFSIVQERQRLVEIARKEFDTTGTGGVENILSNYSIFEQAVNQLQPFRLHSFSLIGTRYSAEEFADRVDNARRITAKHATITTLDQLRNEYHEKGIEVPLPGEFTGDKKSRHYSFTQLNTGDSPWAILNDDMLTALDAITDDMIRNGYKVQINSVYRNPARVVPGSSLRSQHQYGSAVDIQVYDFNGDGRTTSADWELLRALTEAYKPVYTEPMKVSGIGHVHVDWRIPKYVDSTEP